MIYMKLKFVLNDEKVDPTKIILSFRLALHIVT